MDAEISAAKDENTATLFEEYPIDCSIRKERGGEISVAGVGQQGHDDLALVLRPFGQMDRSPDRGARGDADQHALFPSDQLAGGKSVLVLHGDDLIINGGVQHVRDKAWPMPWILWAPAVPFVRRNIRIISRFRLLLWVQSPGQFRRRTLLSGQ